MLSKLALAVEQYALLEKGDTVIVGLSGGADSVSLLHALLSLKEKLGISVLAVHVDHCIRGEEAEKDRIFCTELCQKLGAELVCRRVDVPKLSKEQGIGLEECGRNCRYEIFKEEARRRGAKVATAHTLSDSVETVLFNMSRGASLGGLSGIPAKRGEIIRPLILCEREEIEAYCAENKLEFVTDSTNFDTNYSRNLIRHKVVPQLKKINPSLAQAVCKLSRCAACDEAFLTKLALCELEKAKKGIGYCAESLCALEPALLSRAIREACLQNGAEAQNIHIELIEKCLRSGFGSVTLPGKGRAFVKNGVFGFDREVSSKTTPQEEWICPAELGCNIIPGGKRVVLSVCSLDEFIKSFDINPQVFSQFVDNGKNKKLYFKNCIDYDIIKDSLYLRNRRTGDRFSPNGRGISKSIKELMRENGIPAAERAGLAMLEHGGRLCWIEGFGAADGFGINANTKRILTVEVDV